MIRKLSSLAFGAILALSTTTALAQGEEDTMSEEGGGDEGGGDEGGGDEGGVDEGGGDEGAGDEGGGEAAAGGEAAMDTSNMDAGGKIKIGLRVGYGLPLGDYQKDAKMSDSVSAMIPIWLDLGYMVTPNIMVGLYANYGFIMLDSKVSDACDDCSASLIRFGIQGQYHLSPAESLDPWFGLGLGYEMLNQKTVVVTPAGTATGDANTTGLEFLNLQGGANFKATDSIAVGPFVSFSLGQYSSVEGNDIKDKAMHQWLVLGVGGTLGI